MSLEGWKDSGWLREHETSAKEISGLMALVERDRLTLQERRYQPIGDSISPTTQACNSRRQSCTLPDIVPGRVKANTIVRSKRCL